MPPCVPELPERIRSMLEQRGTLALANLDSLVADRLLRGMTLDKRGLYALEREEGVSHPKDALLVDRVLSVMNARRRRRQLPEIRAIRISTEVSDDADVTELVAGLSSNEVLAYRTGEKGSPKILVAWQAFARSDSIRDYQGDKLRAPAKVISVDPYFVCVQPVDVWFKQKMGE